MKILVAIPAYRCEKQIGRVLAGFDSALLARVAKVLVIDNRSPDGTARAALEGAKKLPAGTIQVVRNAENFGLGGSQKIAFIHALSNGFDSVAILHGDAQATTGDLNRLLDAAEADPNAAAILGARFAQGSKRSGYSRLRTAGNFGLNVLYSVLTGRVITDLGSGLNLFRVRDLSDAGFLDIDEGFIFNQQLLLRLCTKRKRLRFVPIHWSETDQVSNAKTFAVGWRSLKSALLWRAGRLSSSCDRDAGDYRFEVLA